MRQRTASSVQRSPPLSDTELWRCVPAPRGVRHAGRAPSCTGSCAHEPLPRVCNYSFPRRAEHAHLTQRATRGHDMQRKRLVGFSQPRARTRETADQIGLPQRLCSIPGWRMLSPSPRALERSARALGARLPSSWQRCTPSFDLSMRRAGAGCGREGWRSKRAVRRERGPAADAASAA